MEKNLAKYDGNRSGQIDYELWLRILEKNMACLNKLNMKLACKRIHKKQAFESQSFFKYGWYSCMLQLGFSLRNLKIIPIFYLLIVKIPYCLFLPRSVRIWLIDNMKS